MLGYPKETRRLRHQLKRINANLFDTHVVYDFWTPGMNVKLLLLHADQTGELSDHSSLPQLNCCLDTCQTR